MSISVDPSSGNGDAYIVSISDSVTNHSGRFEQSLDDLLVFHAELTTTVNALVSALYESTKESFSRHASEIQALRDQVAKLGEASATNAAAAGAALKAANHQF